MELIVLSSSSAKEIGKQTISCNLIVNQIGEHENIVLVSKTVDFSKDQMMVVVSALITSPNPPNSCSKADADMNIGLQISNCFSVDGGKVTDFLAEPQSIVFHPSFNTATDLYRLWLLGMLPIMEISLHKKHRQWLSPPSLVTVTQGMHSTNFSMSLWDAGPSSHMASPLPLTSKEHLTSDVGQAICPWNAPKEHIHWIWQMLVVLGGISLVVIWMRRQRRLRQQKQGKLRRLASSNKSRARNHGSDTDDDVSSCSSGTSPSRKVATPSFFGVQSRVDFLLADPRPRLPSLQLPIARGRLGRRPGKPIHYLAGVNKEVGWARGTGTSGSGSGCTDADSGSEDTGDSGHTSSVEEEEEEEENDEDEIDPAMQRMLKQDVIKHRTNSDVTRTTVTATATTISVTTDDDPFPALVASPSSHVINRTTHPSMSTPPRQPINTVSPRSSPARGPSSAASSALSNTKKSVLPTATLAGSTVAVRGSAVVGRAKGPLAAASRQGLAGRGHAASGGRLAAGQGLAQGPAQEQGLTQGLAQGLSLGQGLADRIISPVSPPSPTAAIHPPTNTTNTNTNTNTINDNTTALPGTPERLPLDAPVLAQHTAPRPLSPASASHWFLPAPHPESPSSPSSFPRTHGDGPSLDSSPSPSPHAITLSAVSGLSFSGDEMMTMMPVVTAMRSSQDDLPTHAINTATATNNNNHNDHNNNDNNTNQVVHHNIEAKAADHDHDQPDVELTFSFSDVYATIHNLEETMSVKAGAHLLTTHRSIFVASATNKDRDNGEGSHSGSGSSISGGHGNINRPPISPFRSPRIPSRRGSLALPKGTTDSPQQRKGLSKVGRSGEGEGESCVWASVSSVKQETTARTPQSAPAVLSAPLPAPTTQEPHLSAPAVADTEPSSTAQQTTQLSTKQQQQQQQQQQQAEQPLPPSRWQSVVDMPRGHRAPFTSHTPRLRPSLSPSAGAGTGFDAGTSTGGKGKEGKEGTGDASDVVGEDEGDEAPAVVGNVLKHREARSMTDASDWLSAITSADSEDAF